jgi:hypothetical protein
MVIPMSQQIEAKHVRRSFLFSLFTISVSQILPRLTEISSSRFVREGIEKDRFVIWLLVYNWFRNPVSIFLVNSG